MENGDKIVSTALKAEQVLEIFLQRPQVCSLFRIARLLLQIAARSFKQAPRHDTCTALLTEVELSWLERGARATFGGGSSMFVWLWVWHTHEYMYVYI